MPIPALVSLAKQAGKSLEDAERYWQEAEAQAKKERKEGNYAYILGIVKHRLGLIEKKESKIDYNKVLIGDVSIYGLRFEDIKQPYNSMNYAGYETYEDFVRMFLCYEVNMEPKDILGQNGQYMWKRGEYIDSLTGIHYNKSAFADFLKAKLKATLPLTKNESISDLNPKGYDFNPDELNELASIYGTTNTHGDKVVNDLPLVQQYSNYTDYKMNKGVLNDSKWIRARRLVPKLPVEVEVQEATVSMEDSISQSPKVKTIYGNKSADKISSDFKAVKDSEYDFFEYLRLGGCLSEDKFDQIVKVVKSLTEGVYEDKEELFAILPLISKYPNYQPKPEEYEETLSNLIAAFKSYSNVIKGAEDDIEWVGNKGTKLSARQLANLAGVSMNIVESYTTPYFEEIKVIGSLVDKALAGDVEPLKKFMKDKDGDDRTKPVGYQLIVTFSQKAVAMEDKTARDAELKMVKHLISTELLNLKNETVNVKRNYMTPNYTYGDLADVLKHLGDELDVLGLDVKETKPKDVKEAKEDTKEEVLPVGRHNATPDSEFDKDELKKGIKHELEHTDSEDIAKAITKDHLAEFPTYYDALDAMEKQLEELSKEEK